MSNGKFGFFGVVLIFVTISLVFQMDFKKTVTFVFDSIDVDLEEMTNEALEEVMERAIDEKFNQGFYTYPAPTLVENTISEEKYSKLTKIIDLEKDDKATIIRGYENEDTIVVRYYLDLLEDDTVEDVIIKYQEKLINNGYEEKSLDYTNTKFYQKDKIEISFVNKWDCIILMVKGL